MISLTMTSMSIGYRTGTAAQCLEKHLQLIMWCYTDHGPQPALGNIMRNSLYFPLHPPQSTKMQCSIKCPPWPVSAMLHEHLLPVLSVLSNHTLWNNSSTSLRHSRETETDPKEVQGMTHCNMLLGTSMALYWMLRLNWRSCHSSCKTICNVN